MTHDIDTLRRLAIWSLAIASFFTTAFPVLWLFSRWNSTVTGRLLMFQTASFALVLDVTLLFQFWTPKNILVLFWVDVALFGLIALSSAALMWMLWKANYNTRIVEITGRIKLENSTYDKAKWVALVGLPALATLYGALSVLWGLPKPEEVVGTIVAVDTLLGTYLHVDTKSYNDGDLNVVTDPSDGATAVQVATNYKHPANLVQGEKVLLKVNKVTPAVASDGTVSPTPPSV